MGCGMDTEKRMQQLCDEIEEITTLISEWQSTGNPDTLWAIYILDHCLERSKAELRKLLN